jgi:signal transduction histidine kinase
MAVKGNLDLAMSEVAPEQPLRKRLINVVTCVRQATSLTRQLLGFARGGKYETRVIDLNDLITAGIEMYIRTRKDIRIKMELEERIWPVEVDSSQIEQVLINLYVNAGQAMPDGGTLTVMTANADLDEAFVLPYHLPPGQYAHIRVIDTGTGMDKATQARIFDPFFTTKEIGRGTGLGLAPAYGIIKNHNGIIQVTSS